MHRQLPDSYFIFRLELWGIIAVALNAFCDAMDGAVAREMKIQSRRGDFLDHAVDRYADIFIITGIFAGGLVPWQIGVLALTGVLMSSYLGHSGTGSWCRAVLWRTARESRPARADTCRWYHRPHHPHKFLRSWLARLAAGDVRGVWAYNRVPAVHVHLGKGGVRITTAT